MHIPQATYRFILADYNLIAWKGAPDVFMWRRNGRKTQTAQSARLRSLVEAESILQQPMQQEWVRPLFLCGFWMCISIVDWNECSWIFWGVWPWPSTFKGHLKSKIFSPFESPYMTSYITFIVTFSLSHTVFEIFDFKVFRVWPWPSEVTWGQKYVHHSKAHTWLPI